jgi:uncharacterized protein (TIRG00374 family)
VRLFTVLVLVAALGLFGWLLQQTDLGAVAEHIGRLGWWGTGLIVLLFGFAFQADVVAWHLTFRALPLSLRWSWRLWGVNLVGEALNVVTPFGSLGGEPFKAVLLKRHYRVPYSEATGSLLLIQAVNTLAELPFIIAGVVMMYAAQTLPAGYRVAGLMACLVIGGFMILMVVLLNARVFSRVATWLQGRGALWHRLYRALAAVYGVERHMAQFLSQRPGRFAASVGLAFLNWLHGAVEIYVVLWLLGTPLSFWECWQIEAAVVMVRSATFFVPANLGTQDGALGLLIGLLTGSMAAGLAVALIRRIRELIWTGAGLLVGGWLTLRPALHGHDLGGPAPM